MNQEEMPVEEANWGVEYDDSLKAMLDDANKHPDPIAQADDSTVFGITAKDLKRLQKAINTGNAVAALSILRTRSARLPHSMMGMKINQTIQELLGGE